MDEKRSNQQQEPEQLRPNPAERGRRTGQRLLPARARHGTRRVGSGRSPELPRLCLLSHLASTSPASLFEPSGRAAGQLGSFLSICASSGHRGGGR